MAINPDAMSKHVKIEGDSVWLVIDHQSFEIEMRLDGFDEREDKRLTEFYAKNLRIALARLIDHATGGGPEE